MAICFQAGAPIDLDTRLRAVIAQQVSLQSQMSGLIAAFWLITASFVVMVPLLTLPKAGIKQKAMHRW